MLIEDKVRLFYSSFNLVNELFGERRRLDEHRHVDWQIDDFAFHGNIVIAQHVCQRDAVVAVFEHIVQCAMAFVVLAAFHFERQGMAVEFHDEI